MKTKVYIGMEFYINDPSEIEEPNIEYLTAELANIRRQIESGKGLKISTLHHSVKSVDVVNMEIRIPK